VSFSVSGIPDNGTCNFLVVTITDSAGAVARRSIVPCPDSGGALPAGVSGVTASQTDALLSAFSSAGSDDPVLATFGFAIVRSSGMSSTDLATMASLANQGINNSGGFIDYLTSNGVSTAQLLTYRQSIVSRLADPDSGYSKLYKDAVDSTDSTTAAEKRGEAAALLLKVLVQAATTAGFPQDRVLEAFNAMGSIVIPLMQQAVTDGNLSAAGSQMVDSNIGGGITKLRAEKLIEKYANALTTLGGSAGDLTQYTNAATTLTNAMISSFQTFEQVFTGSETDAEIQAAQTAMDTAMQSAFSAFMTSTAATNARITTMISNIDTALGSSTGLTISDFQFYDSGGTAVNWPVTMVIPTEWVSSIVTAGGSLSYTRDTTAIPAAMTWRGSCSNSSYFDRTTCEANSGTWTAARNSFSGTPASYAALLGLQEDVMILEFTRWSDQSSAGTDMSAHQTLEKSFADKMTALAGNLGGTTDGSTATSSTQKSALVTLMQSPQF
jgi:hypothetical protein